MRPYQHSIRAHPGGKPVSLLPHGIARVLYSNQSFPLIASPLVSHEDPDEHKKETHLEHWQAPTGSVAKAREGDVVLGFCLARN